MSRSIPTTVVVKVTYFNHDGELVTRKIPVDKVIKFSEFHDKIRSYFNVRSNVETEIYYTDEEDDCITVTYDDELQAALENNPPVKFELVIKNKSIFFSYRDD